MDVRWELFIVGEELMAFERHPRCVWELGGGAVMVVVVVVVVGVDCRMW